MLTGTRAPAPRAPGTVSGGGVVVAGRPASPGAKTVRAAAAVEFALTGSVLFVLVTAVRWVMASPFSRFLPEAHHQLAAVAVIVGAALAWALSSRWGRYSGGHLNPAVTLALWLTGAFPGRNVLPYIAAQLTGSVVGAGLARLLWGPVVADRMAYAAVQPTPAWSDAAQFTTEDAATAAIITVAFLLMSHPAWAKWIPLALPTATAAVIVALGPLTGGSANPARQFDPALWADKPAHLWAYLLVPLAGAALTALAARCRSRRSGQPRPASPLRAG
ncbi:aquaporin [Streptomyces sp. NPDC096311]|uniref:aquaporin n=1 Tax=Streptomyces sp. NPDC096311 TaxID=3366083 RepID=UPI003816D0B7